MVQVGDRHLGIITVQVGFQALRRTKISNERNVDKEGMRCMLEKTSSLLSHGTLHLLEWGLQEGTHKKHWEGMAREAGARTGMCRALETKGKECSGSRERSTVD